MMRNPVMFIVEVGSVLTTYLFIRDFGEQHRKPELVRRTGCGVVVVHRALRQLRRSDGRGPRQGPGGGSAQDTRRHDRTRPDARRLDRHRSRRLHSCVGRPVRRRRRRGHSRRRRDHRGHRHGRRVGDHRRVGARHPRIRRRSLGRHRRDTGAERRDRRAHHSQAGRDVPRPDDRARRGRQPAEDARTRSPCRSCSPG